ACATCHCAPSENRTARTKTSAFGFSSAAFCMCGMASLIALLRDWILPSACMEPEQSQIQKKCNGRDASSPPGRLLMCEPPSLYSLLLHSNGNRDLQPERALRNRNAYYAGIKLCASWDTARRRRSGIAASFPAPALP